MAFSASKTDETVFGNKRVTMGTFTNTGGSTGGDINTGLHVCEKIFLQCGGSAVSADAPAINETLPCAGSSVTCVTTADVDGWWMAIGY